MITEMRYRLDITRLLGREVNLPGFRALAFDFHDPHRGQWLASFTSALSFRHLVKAPSDARVSTETCPRMSHTQVKPREVFHHTEKRTLERKI